MISPEQLLRIEFCLTTVKSVTVNQGSKLPSYVIEHDVGQGLLNEHFNLTKKTSYFSSAQLMSNHSPEALKSVSLLTVVNFPRKQIGKFMSDCLTTGVLDEHAINDDIKRCSTVACGLAELNNPGSSVSWFGEDSKQLQTNQRTLTLEEFKRAVIYSGTIKELLGGSKGRWNFLVDYGTGPVRSVAHLNLDDPSPMIGMGCLACRNVSPVPVLMTYNAESLVAPLNKCPNGLVLA